MTESIIQVNLAPFYQKLVSKFSDEKDMKKVFFPLLREHLHESLEAIAQEIKYSRKDGWATRLIPKIGGISTRVFQQQYANSDIGCLIYTHPDWVTQTLGEGALMPQRESVEIVTFSFWGDLFAVACKEGRDFFYDYANPQEKAKDIPLKVPGIVPVHVTDEGTGGYSKMYGIRVK